MAACEAGSFEICEVLVKAGVDVEVLRHDGATALGLSVLSSNWKCVDLCMRCLSIALVSSHATPFVVVSDLWQLASRYLQSFIIHAQLRDGVSPRALVGEIGAVLLAIETKTHDSIKTDDIVALTMQLRRVRAFIDHNRDILQDPPVLVAHTLMQLAAQEVHVLFEADYVKMPAPQGAYQPAIIEWLNKPHTFRHCQWTLQANDQVKAVAYSTDGAKLARAEGVMVVVCDVVSGFELCRLRGHSKDNPECICQHGENPWDYKAKRRCPATGHSYW